MKNQYFGDIRDLFKYDLIQYLITNISFLNNLYFIPLLTEDDSSSEGNITNYKRAIAGYLNNDLISFLRDKRLNDRRVAVMEEYFNKFKIDNYIVPELFYHKNRQAYFRDLTSQIQDSSLVFFDPDNGLEVKHNNEKHVLFSEVESIYSSIGENTIIMIYQHFPRVRRDLYIKERLVQLVSNFNPYVTYLSDMNIVFFLVAKSNVHYEELSEIVSKYNDTYPRLDSEYKKIEGIDRKLGLFS